MNDFLKSKRKYLVIVLSIIIISSFITNNTLHTNNVECKKNNELVLKPIITNWWNASWQYSREVVINNPNSLLIDYAVKVMIPFYFDYGNASDTGADIRFTRQDNSTLLNHWIEEWDNASDSTVWVKIPTLAAITNTIFLYYGNSLANDVSNGTLVFDAFDDFSGTELNENLWNVTTWAEGGSRNYGVSNGELNVNITSPGNDLLSGYQFSIKEKFSYGNFSLYVKARWLTLDYVSGYGLFCSPIIIDNNNGSNYHGLALMGAENVVTQYHLGYSDGYMDATDYTLGNVEFYYKGSTNNYYDFDLDGTYRHGFGSYGSIIDMPCAVGLESLIRGANESGVSVRVFYDLFCFRQSAENEPTSEIIIEGAPDIFDPTIQLVSPDQYETYPANQTIILYVDDNVNGTIRIDYRWDSDFYETFYTETVTYIEFYLPTEPGYHILRIYATDEADNTASFIFSFYTYDGPIITPTTIISGYSTLTTTTIALFGIVIANYLVKRKRK